MQSPLLRTSYRAHSRSSWSCLARPSTSLPASDEPCPSKLVDGRTKSDHDGVVRTDETSYHLHPRLCAVVLLDHAGEHRGHAFQGGRHFSGFEHQCDTNVTLSRIEAMRIGPRH